MTTAAAHTPIAGDDGDDGRTTRARMLPPPTLSINRLITTHARERLVVHPLLWTDRHLALLQCRFHPHGDVVAEQDGTLTPPSVPEDPRLDPRRLRRRLPFLDLEDVVYGLLTSVGYQDAASMTTSRERVAQLYFRKCSHAKIQYCLEEYSIPTGAAAPLEFALFDFSAIRRRRRDRLFPPLDRLDRPNPPGFRRGQNLLTRYTPAVPEKDPYLVALTIALAQKQRREYRKSLMRSPSGYSVRLVFAGQGENTPLIVYFAQVQDAFLDKLSFPDRVPLVNSGLDIHYWRLSPEPYDTLAQRFHQALRFNCSGEHIAHGAVGSLG